MSPLEQRLAKLTCLLPASELLGAPFVAKDLSVAPEEDGEGAQENDPTGEERAKDAFHRALKDVQERQDRIRARRRKEQVRTVICGDRTPAADRSNRPPFRAALRPRRTPSPARERCWRSSGQKGTMRGEDADISP